MGLSIRASARHRGVSEAAVRETIGESTPSSGLGPTLGSGGTIFLQACTANEVRLALPNGDLVDRSQAIAQVFKLPRSERDVWLNWPARIVDHWQRLGRAGLNPDRRGFLWD